jgi:hypothetical protein
MTNEEMRLNPVSADYSDYPTMMEVYEIINTFS